MLRQRVLVVVVLLPVGLWAIYWGGWLYALVVGILLGLASWEFGGLFAQAGLQPARVLMTLASLALLGAAALERLDVLPAVLGGATLLLMSYHMLRYERGRDQAATDFAVSLSGVVYIGLLGAYLIAVRQLPDGLWWVLVVLPSIWVADSAAYFIGKAWGRHRLSPRLSPKKTWEGYLAGVLAGVLGGAGFAALWNALGADALTLSAARGAWLGLFLSVLAPLGDLGESMVKRQVGAKDSSHLIPGHGGAFDRVDSWLWAGFLGYFFIRYVFLG